MIFITMEQTTGIEPATWTLEKSRTTTVLRLRGETKKIKHCPRSAFAKQSYPRRRILGARWPKTPDAIGGFTPGISPLADGFEYYKDDR